MRLGVADVVLIAARVLGVAPRVAADLLDLDAVAAALAEARAVAGRPEHAAAALLLGLLRRRISVRAGSRIALVATLQVLAMDGWDLDLDPPGATTEWLRRAAAGAVGDAEATAWLARRLRPREQPGDPSKRKERRMFGRRKEGGWGMFQRFTGPARDAVIAAQDEARRLGHDHVGTAHTLLGLLREGDNGAARALGSFGATLESARRGMEELSGRGASVPKGHIPFTPAAKKTLELALRMALRLGHNYIGAEHILLGILEGRDADAAGLLQRLGIDPEALDERVLEEFETSRTPQPERLLEEVKAVLDDNDRLRGEVRRLREELRRRGIEPDDRPESA